MLIPSVQDASASTDLPAESLVPLPSHEYEIVRHMLFGNFNAVQTTIRLLHKRGYAEANDWSQPISTGRPNEVMAILTKPIRLESQ